MNFIQTLSFQFLETLPYFMLILLGYVLVRFFKWTKTTTDSLTKFTFWVVIPVMLFNMMKNFSEEQGESNYGVLIAFFGGSLIVYVISRIIGAKCFKLDGENRTMFAMTGIYSNSVFVGIPIIRALFGDGAIPCVSLIVAFNAMILWTIATVSIELAVIGKVSIKSIVKIFKPVSSNPVILGIFVGLVFNFIHIPIPEFIGKPTKILGDMGAPLSLVVLGMGLAEYKINEGIKISATICFIKLIFSPFIIFIITQLLQLPEFESKIVVIVGSMSIAINCYMMSRQFNLLKPQVASSLLISTALSAITTPFILTMMTLYFSFINAG